MDMGKVILFGRKLMLRKLAVLAAVGLLTTAAHANSHDSEASKTLCILLVIKNSVPNVNGVKLISGSVKYREKNKDGTIFYNVHVVVSVLGKKVTLVDSCRVRKDGSASLP